MHNLEIPVWSNDGKSVHYMKSLVRGADPKSFEVLLGLYARDANHIFFGPSKCQKMDRDTFKPLNACFGVDSSSAYFCIAPVKQANPTSFRSLDSGLTHNGSKHCSGGFLRAGYCADDKAVWFCSGGGVLRLKAAESGSFVSLGNRFGYDQDRVYYENKLIAGVHRQTWRHWSGLLSADKDNIFFAERMVEGVHRASAVLLEVQDCFMDKNRLYSGGSVISAEQYLDLLKYLEEACARERKGLADGSLFQRLLSEWPEHF
jgi:hypothetical protein